MKARTVAILFILSIVFIIFGTILMFHIEMTTLYGWSTPTMPYMIPGAILVGIGGLLLMASIYIWVWKLGKRMIREAVRESREPEKRK